MSCLWRCKSCWQHQTGRLSQSQNAAKHSGCDQERIHFKPFHKWSCDKKILKKWNDIQIWKCSKGSPELAAEEWASGRLYWRPRIWSGHRYWLSRSWGGKVGEIRCCKNIPNKLGQRLKVSALTLQNKWCHVCLLWGKHIFLEIQIFTWNVWVHVKWDVPPEICDIINIETGWQQKKVKNSFLELCLLHVCLSH